MTHDPAPILCGTRAGYTRHLRNGETPCEECKGANTLWQRLYRARTGRQYETARSRALTRLAQKHPDEYRAIYREERGLAP